MCVFGYKHHCTKLIMKDKETDILGQESSIIDFRKAISMKYFEKNHAASEIC